MCARTMPGAGGTKHEDTVFCPGAQSRGDNYVKATTTM
jgi:hypothetical protein